MWSGLLAAGLLALLYWAACSSGALPEPVSPAAAPTTWAKQSCPLPPQAASCVPSGVQAMLSREPVCVASCRGQQLPQISREPACIISCRGQQLP